MGGIVGDMFGIRRPFEVAMALMLLSTFYSIFFLPYIPPSQKTESEAENSTMKRAAGVLAPMKLFIPTRIVMPDGRIRRHYGVLLLGAGVFLGVVSRPLVTV